MLCNCSSFEIMLMVNLQEADLLFTPAEVLACHFPLRFAWQHPSRFELQHNLCSKMTGFVLAQLEFFAEDEDVDIVPNFQVQDPVHDEMLTIAAVRFGRCPDASSTSGWLLEQEQ